MPRSTCLWFLRNIFALRSIFLILIAFLAPVSLLQDSTTESRCAYVLIVMAILWLTEALPIPVTALMPVFLIPFFGILPGKTVCGAYVNDTSMLFLGGLIVAVAVEEVNLHRRIAMAILALVGSQPNLLMLGLMLPTWFLSMWISNTAATSMMVPIITAVTDQMRGMEIPKTADNAGGKDNDGFDDIETGDKEKTTGNKAEIKVDNGDVENQGQTNTKKKEDELKRISKGFALCVAYAANVGGVATLTGTPPNLILQGQANDLYNDRLQGADSGITFAKWMGFGIPLSIIVLVLSWIWLQLFFLRCSCFQKSDKSRRKAVKRIIALERKKLGPVKFGEVIVLCLFIVLAFLWIFRDIPGLGGWKALFKEDPKSGPYVRDSTAAMLIAVLLFFLPLKLPNVLCWNKYSEKENKPKYQPILTWQKTVAKLPWGVIILLGGGFALASATTASGLSKQVGCSLRVFNTFEPWIMNAILTLIIAAATEITSNSATATILMPIMAELAINTGSHPLYLMMSAAVACSFAFMLPVATPPNAIVFSTGYVRIPDMAMAGFTMNIIAVLTLNLAINAWGKALFDLDTMPAIFQNATGDSCGTASTMSTIGNISGNSSYTTTSVYTTSILSNDTFSTLLPGNGSSFG